MSRWPKRGDVYGVNLDPVVGTEKRKTRPAIIVSNDSDADIRTVRTGRLVTNVTVAKETVEVETKHSNWSHCIRGGRTPM